MNSLKIINVFILLILLSILLSILSCKRYALLRTSMFSYVGRNQWRISKRTCVESCAVSFIEGKISIYFQMSKRFTGIICIKILLQAITQEFMEQTIIHSYQLQALYNMNYSTKAPPDFVNASLNQMKQLIVFQYALYDGAEK